MMPEKATVKLSDLLDAFVWVCAGAIGDNGAFICRETGRIYWTSHLMELDNPPPEDIDDASRYLAVPHKYDLDLGTALLFRFVGDVLPNDFDTVSGFFSRKGAYRKFNDYLDRRDALDAWHQYQDEATEKALREWCEGNGLMLAAPDVERRTSASQAIDQA